MLLPKMAKALFGEVRYQSNARAADLLIYCFHSMTVRCLTRLRPINQRANLFAGD